MFVEFSGQEYWSGLPFPSPGDLPVPGIEPRSPALQTNFLPSEPPGKPREKEREHKLPQSGIKEKILPVTSQKFQKSLIELYEQLYANKLDSLDKMDKFPEIHKLSKPT